MGRRTMQLLALCRKTYWLKRNRWILSFLEFFLSAGWIVAGAILTSHVISTTQPVSEDPAWSRLPPVTNTSNWVDCSSQNNGTCVLAVSPNFNETHPIPALLMANLLQRSESSIAPLQYQFFESEDDLLVYYNANPSLVWNAVIFSEDLFNFTIRTNLTYLPQSNSGAKFNPFAFLNQDIGDSDHYLSNGVCTLQQAVALSLLEYSNSSTTSFSLGVKELPTPNITISSPSAILVFISPLVLLGFIPSFLISLVGMVSEKAAKTKEYMKMMGLSESVYTLSWIISSSLPIFFLTFVFIIANYSTGVFHHSSGFFLVLFFFSFALSVIAFVFLSASFCDSTRTCILTGGMWLYAVNSFALFVPSVSFGWQYVLSLLAPLNFTLGFFLISTSEGSGKGIHFGDDVVMGISLGHLTLLMLLDTLIYSLLAWYIQKVRPGEWGIPKPLAFPLMPSYWKSVYESVFSKKKKRDGYIELPANGFHSKGMEELVEDPADHFVESVRIQNLTKVFSDLDRPAVNNLSLSFYQGEIHVLLGHNGAGKSTTISMLTGLLPPTSGGALIEGYQLPEQIDKVREIIGVCLQQDILWDKLSALEHLRFFAHLKGVPEKDINRSVESLLSGVGLERKHWDKPTQGYSGGMKRKVSLAIALIGDSKVVLLDEPTTGMDPVSRRFLYNFLAEAKKGRVIILTTHYMEEAEVLGDRSTIIARGRLQCSGSGVFLKNKFGVGYFLNIIKNQSSSDNSDIRSLVKRHVFNAVIRSETPLELFVLLPTSDTQAFPALFGELEDMISKNRITDFNISMTTLEDVFLKIASREDGEAGRGLEEKQNEEEEVQEQYDNYCSISVTDTSPPVFSISRRQIIVRQLFPLIRRRFLNVLRNKELLLFLVLTPIISICLTSFAFKYTEYLVNQGVVSNDMVVPLVVDLNVTSIPIVDLTNSSEVVTNLLAVLGDLTDPSLLFLESTVSDLEQMVLSAYNNASSSSSVISGGYVFDQQELLNGGVGGLNVTVFYNQSVTMSLPAFFTQIHNVFLREVVSNNSSLFFTTNIHALPGDSPVVTFSSISVSVFISLSLLLSIFGRDIVVERVNDLKWQLLLGSMDILSYWISNFIADFLLYMIPVTISWVVLRLVGDDPFVGHAFPALAILTICFTISALLSQYVLSYLLKKPDNALVLLHVTNILSGFIPYILYLVLTSLGATEIASYVSAPTPTGTLLGGLQDLQNLSDSNSADIWSWENNIPKRVLFFSLQTLFFIILLYIIESRSLKITGTTSDSSTPQETFQQTSQEEPPDVSLERQRLERKSCSDPVLLKHISKCYSSRPVVNDISLGVKRGECLGYLGPNGAGKSTSIGMATGRFAPSLGQVLLEGRLTTNANQQDLYGRLRMGVCLQTDSLFDHLTAREHLELFINIRPELFSLSKKQMNYIIDTWIRDLNLTPHADRSVKTYSGGNKRKLCVALAMLENKLVFLDEPSSGMDPDARRALWNVIVKAKSKNDSSIILTTHSMDEAEAVCDRVVIMVSGRLKALGTAQGLKSRFGTGYRLNLKYHGTKDNSDLSKRLHDFITRTFPSSKLLESLPTNCTYELGPIASLSSAFRDLEELRQQFGIREFVITQNSLEQVFMHLVKEAQFEEDG